MKYSKPEIINLGSTGNIQLTSKVDGCIEDNPRLHTCSAYEADE
jgi:hypothetical protein